MLALVTKLTLFVVVDDDYDHDGDVSKRHRCKQAKFSILQRAYSKYTANDDLSTALCCCTIFKFCICYPHCFAKAPEIELLQGPRIRASTLDNHLPRFAHKHSRSRRMRQLERVHQPPEYLFNLTLC